MTPSDREITAHSTIQQEKYYFHGIIAAAALGPCYSSLQWTRKVAIHTKGQEPGVRGKLGAQVDDAHHQVIKSSET